jgi:hypothetical protein
MDQDHLQRLLLLYRGMLTCNAPSPTRDIALIVPEMVPTGWYHYLLHNQTAALIKA